MAGKTNSQDTSIAQPQRISLGEKSLDRQLEWIRAVENKLSVLVAIDVAMIGLVLSRFPVQATAWWGTSILGVLSAMVLGVSVVYCGLASFPRTKNPNLSIIYFGSIAQHSVDELRSKVGKLSEAEYLEDLVQQVHRNATIARAKFGKVKIATGLMFGGILPWAGFFGTGG